VQKKKLLVRFGSCGDVPFPRGENGNSRPEELVCLDRANKIGVVVGLLNCFLGGIAAFELISVV
jgi:hypothetical protein